jgi:hypothetical protein
MNLSKLSERELVELIAKASAELSTRINAADVARIPAPRTVIAVREPGAEQKDFMLMIASMLRAGKYIKAAEREAVAEISAEFPEWARLQQIPSGSSAGNWRRAAEYQSAPRAKEK